MRGSCSPVRIDDLAINAGRTDGRQELCASLPRSAAKVARATAAARRAAGRICEKPAHWRLGEEHLADEERMSVRRLTADTARPSSTPSGGHPSTRRGVAGSRNDVRHR